MTAALLLRFVTPLLVLSAAAAHAQPIRSPWDAHPVTLTDAPAACPELPAVPANLTTDGFYRLDDPTHSIVDPRRMAAYTASSGPPKAAAAAIVKEADLFRTTGSRAAAVCTVNLLDAMAQHNSLGGHMSSGQAYYVQGWLAGAMAIAFLKVRGSGVASDGQIREIAAWLDRLAASQRAWYDAALRKKPEGNNHLYWAGLEMCATAAVAGNRGDFDWCLAAYRNGLRQIAPDGTLPLEMARGTRALHYHLYALAPLVLIAEFGEANGLPLYAEDHGALERLANLSIAGIADPSFFAARTGVQQEFSGQPEGDAIAWAPPYNSRYPSAALSQYIAGARNLSSFYMGGLPPPPSHP